MPPQSIVNKRSNVVRKPKWRGRRRQTPTYLAAKAAAKSVVKRTLNRYLERKEKYYEDFASDMTTVGAVNIISDIVSGTQSDQMIGSKCHLLSAYIKYNITAADTTNIVRLLVVQSMQQEASMNLTSVFNTTQFSSQPWNALYDSDYVPSRYRVLYDKTIQLDTDDSVYTGYINIRKLARKTLQYANDPSVSVTPGKGHLFFCYLSDSAVTTHPTINWCSITRFRDS